ncbi:hypothetical protein [Streptomyces avermitilis]|uniref:hypothetical protein n=1 Tax=Streptomyces avermitilis TaxID=33903 RepID=UPI003811F21F
MKPQLDIASTAAARMAAAAPIIDPAIFGVARSISAQIGAMPAYRFAAARAALSPEDDEEDIAAEDGGDATEEENADE